MCIAGADNLNGHYESIKSEIYENEITVLILTAFHLLTTELSVCDYHQQQRPHRHCYSWLKNVKYTDVFLNYLLLVTSPNLPGDLTYVLVESVNWINQSFNLAGTERPKPRRVSLMGPCLYLNADVFSVIFYVKVFRVHDIRCIVVCHKKVRISKGLY